MTVSVLIPAYQAGHLIQGALDCLRRQTHADWQLIVIEDGSHDETESQVDAFSHSVQQSVRYHNLGINRGISAARDAAIADAQSDLIAFLDADDYWDDHYLEAAVDQISRGADLVVSSVRAFDFTTGKELYRRTPPETLAEDPVTSLMGCSVVVTSSSVVLKRTLCEQVGAFDAGLLIGEDRDYWLRCALEGARFGCSSDAFAHYAKHSGGTMTKILLWAEQDVKFQRKYQGLLQVPASLRRKALGTALENYGRLLRGENPRRSAACLIEAWRLAPARLRRLGYAGYSLSRMLFPQTANGAPR